MPVSAELVQWPCRSPYGERGLKYAYFHRAALPLGSLPVRGAWIEINFIRDAVVIAFVAPRTGSVD